jgi:hypothetical protein
VYGGISIKFCADGRKEGCKGFSNHAWISPRMSEVFKASFNLSDSSGDGN